MDGGGDGGTLEMDRLSSLPDGVLCHILSKLPTKYSARTSALSTRWKYLFLSIPIIDCHLFTRTYNFEDRDTDGYATLVSFVTRALNLITTNLLHITKFRIYLKHFQRYSLPVSVVCSWIVTAVKYNVQEIDFYCVNMESGPLPCELFTSRTLVDLKLMLHFVLSVPDSVCLPNLKTLLLGYYVSSDEKSLKKLLLSCPVLEELFLSCQMGKAKVVEVSSLSLKKLSFNIRESRRYRILLNTPNLEYLSCGTYASRGYSGDPPSSIGKAYINVKLSMEREIDKTKICQLLQLVSGTRFLSLYGDVLEALHFSKCSLPMFGNLTHLELSNDGLYGWKKLPGILQASPRLEVLVLEWGDLNHDVDFTGFTFSKPKSVPECLSVCLKTVKFKKFLGEKPEYQFIEFLLKNGGVLQKIIVRKESKDSRFDIDLEVELSDVDEEIQSEMEEYFEISKKLLSFPRRSRECQIVFDAVPMTKEAYIAKLKEIDGSSDSDTK